MTNKQTIDFITKKLEKDCSAITATMVVELITSQQEEIERLKKDLARWILSPYLQELADLT